MGHPNGYRPYGHKAPMQITRDEELIALELDEAVKVWLTHQIQEGKMTTAEADEYWKEYNGKAKAGALLVPSALDAGIAGRVIKDLGLHRAMERSYRGRMYIIFKGNHRTRSLITGTRYSVANPKIVSLGIGKAGLKNTARKGGILSIVIVSVFNVAQLILNDKYTLSHFLGDMAVDIGIIVASTAIGLAAGVAASVFIAAAVGPLIAVIAVTVAVAFVLGWAAEKLELSKKITAALDSSFAFVEAEKAKAKHSLHNKVDDITIGVTKFIIKTGNNYLADILRRSVPRRRGNFNWMQW